MPCKKAAFLLAALEMVAGLKKDADKRLQGTHKGELGGFYPIQCDFPIWLEGMCLLLPCPGPFLAGPGHCSHTMLFPGCNKTQGAPQRAIGF